MNYYERTETAVEWEGHTLYQIKAIQDFPVMGIKQNDLGGFIENEDCLEDSGYCWVDTGAYVYRDTPYDPTHPIIRKKENEGTITPSRIGTGADIYATKDENGDSSVVLQGITTYGEVKIKCSHLTIDTTTMGSSTSTENGKIQIHEDSNDINGAVISNSTLKGNIEISNGVIMADTTVENNAQLNQQIKIHGGIHGADNSRPKIEHCTINEFATIHIDNTTDSNVVTTRLEYVNMSGQAKLSGIKFKIEGTETSPIEIKGASAISLRGNEDTTYEWTTGDEGHILVQGGANIQQTNITGSAVFSDKATIKESNIIGASTDDIKFADGCMINSATITIIPNSNINIKDTACITGNIKIVGKVEISGNSFVHCNLEDKPEEEAEDQWYMTIIGDSTGNGVIIADNSEVANNGVLSGNIEISKNAVIKGNIYLFSEEDGKVEITDSSNLWTSPVERRMSMGTFDNGAIHIGGMTNIKNTSMLACKNSSIIIDGYSDIRGYDDAEYCSVNITSTVNTDIKISGSPTISGYVDMKGSVTISDDPVIKSIQGNANSKVLLSGKVNILGYSKIEGNVKVCGYATIKDNALIFNSGEKPTLIYGNATLFENATIYSGASIMENARVYGRASILQEAVVKGNVRLHGDVQVVAPVTISGDKDISTGCINQ